jgi:hypothetical protein
VLFITDHGLTTTKKTIQGPDLARVEAALQQAAQKARKTAKDTCTPPVNPNKI